MKQKTKLVLNLISVILIFGLLCVAFYYFYKIEPKNIGPTCFTHQCLSTAGLVKGINGGAMKFNDTLSIKIYNESLNKLGEDDFKIDLWVKTSQDTIGDLFSKGYPNSTWFALVQRNSKNNYQIWAQIDNDKIGPIAINSNTSFNDNEWHHIVVDYNRTELDWLIRFYVDGSLENEKQLINFGLFNSTSPLMIGTGCAFKSLANSNGCFEYWGSLDEIKIYFKDKLIFYEGFNDNFKHENF